LAGHATHTDRRKDRHSVIHAVKLVPETWAKNFGCVP